MFLRLLLAALLAITVSAQAADNAAGSNEGAVPTPNEVEQRLISLDLNKTLVKTAIEALFTGTGLNYAIDPALDNPPYDSMMVSLSIRDVPFDQAIKTLVKALNVTYRKDGGVYIFSVKTPAANTAESMPGVTPEDSGKPDMVTMVLLPMPIKNAVAKLSVSPKDGTEMPSWEFANDLGNTRMPGVKFYSFPRYQAIQFTIAASGLVPPVGIGGQVEIRGDVDMSKLFSWEQMGGSSGVRDAAYYTAIGTTRRASALLTAVSIAARKVGDKWLLTIITNQAFDVDVIEKLFAFTGESYVIGARSPFTATKSLSAKLYDVTLDQALDVLLPSVGMTYRKAGLSKNPTYVVSDTGTHYQPGPTRPPVVPRPK